MMIKMREENRALASITTQSEWEKTKIPVGGGETDRTQAAGNYGKIEIDGGLFSRLEPTSGDGGDDLESVS